MPVPVKAGISFAVALWFFSLTYAIPKNTLGHKKYKKEETKKCSLYDQSIPYIKKCNHMGKNSTSLDTAVHRGMQTTAYCSRLSLADKIVHSDGSVPIFHNSPCSELCGAPTLPVMLKK